MDNILSVKSCADYSHHSVKEAIISLLNPFGGIAAFVKPGNRVLLKPNMLSCKEPEKAATTHPSILEALAKLCFEAGAKEVLIGDSPPMIFGRTEKFWEKTGFKKAAENSGAKLISFESEKKKQIELTTNGKKVKVHLLALLWEVDTVINLPKMKTHNLTRITGATKNLFGLVPGMEKAQWHKVFTKSDQFGTFMADLATQIPTHLTIMDGISAMEGQGPAGGDVIQPNVLLAATKPLNVDLGFCKIANIEPKSVSTLNQLLKAPGVPQGINELELHGDDLKKLVKAGYKVPATPIPDRLPDFLLNLIKRFLWAGPELIPGECIKCKKCMEICPVEAISFEKNNISFDRNKCVSCFCCMEVCPKDAIEMKTSPLLSVGLKIRGMKRKRKKQ